ncbi:MAG: hypothetical protein BGN97_11195 [Microbacterium sp. 69-10]|uniref:histidine phosphatase family protein n=1 Tax=Microbacterium sp. 69-10 TaxID=1895783 RepID=UPI0009678CA2|nr:histidine phosphatase family protein [Microbacterium sp. 69-10]OJU40400.1 MAG: hypothetical protein BGN97_11195 [Microbacterium sp. 69-10]
MTRILIIRHGETSSSRLGQFTGREDVQLTEKGRSQARQWSGQLGEFVAASATEGTFFSSPLHRCRETAQLAIGSEARSCEDLIEWDLGTLHGVSADDFRRDHPNWNLFSDGPPDGSGESPVDIRMRASRVLERLRESRGDVVLFTHGQFAKVLIAFMLGLPQATASRFALGPARGALVMERTSGLSLAGWNLAPNADGLWKALT